MNIFGLRLFRPKAVTLTEVFSETTNKRTGTVVQQALNNSHNRLTGGMDGLCDGSAGVTRLISYGKNTPLYKAGIHQAQITTLNNGAKKYQYFNKGKEIFNMGWAKDRAFEEQILTARDGEHFLLTDTGYIPRKHLLSDTLEAVINTMSRFS